MEYTQVEGLQFRNSFVEAIEELRLHRTINLENEDKIRQLVVDKHMLESKCDEESRRASQLEQQHKEATAATCRQHREEIKQLQEAKAKASATCDSHQYEVKALKDEVRVLQMTRYNMEKRLREQEQKLRLEEASRGSTVTLIAELDQKCKTLSTRFTGYGQQQERLDKEVKEAQRLNQRLKESCKHQESCIHGYKERLGRMKQEMVGLYRRLAAQPLQANDKLAVFQRELVVARQTFKEKEKVNEILTRQNETLEEECKKLQASVKDLHALMARQADGATKSATEVATCRQELEQLQSYQKELEAVVASRDEELMKQALERAEEQETCKNLEISLKEEVKQLEAEREKLQQACGGLREQTGLLNTQRDLLQQQLTQAQEELNKPKEDKATEIIVECKSSECQTLSRWPEVEQSTQTETAVTLQTGCQTNVVLTHHGGTQTDTHTAQTRAIQTETKQQLPASCQTQSVSVRSTGSQSPTVTLCHSGVQMQPILKHIGIQNSLSTVSITAKGTSDNLQEDTTLSVAIERLSDETDQAQPLKKVGSSSIHSKHGKATLICSKVELGERVRDGQPVSTEPEAVDCVHDADTSPKPGSPPVGQTAGALSQGSPESVPDSPASVCSDKSQIGSPPGAAEPSGDGDDQDELSQLSPYSRFRAKLQHIATRSPEYYRGIQALHQDEEVDPDLPLAQRLLRRTPQLSEKSDILASKENQSRKELTGEDTSPALRSLRRYGTKPPGLSTNTSATSKRHSSLCGILKDPGMQCSKRQKTVHFATDVPSPATPTPPSSADAASIPVQLSPADGSTTAHGQHLPDTNAGGDYSSNHRPYDKDLSKPAAPSSDGDQTLHSDNEDDGAADYHGYQMDHAQNIHKTGRLSLRSVRQTNRSSSRNPKPD